MTLVTGSPRSAAGVNISNLAYLKTNWALSNGCLQQTVTYPGFEARVQILVPHICSGEVSNTSPSPHHFLRSRVVQRGNFLHPREMRYDFFYIKKERCSVSSFFMFQRVQRQPVTNLLQSYIPPTTMTVNLQASYQIAVVITDCLASLLLDDCK